jgi:hypothetical protein
MAQQACMQLQPRQQWCCWTHVGVSLCQHRLVCSCRRQVAQSLTAVGLDTCWALDEFSCRLHRPVSSCGCSRLTHLQQWASTCDGVSPWQHRLVCSCRPSRVPCRETG